LNLFKTSEEITKQNKTKRTKVREKERKEIGTYKNQDKKETLRRAQTHYFQEKSFLSQPSLPSLPKKPFKDLQERKKTSKK